MIYGTYEFVSLANENDISIKPVYKFASHGMQIERKITRKWQKKREHVCLRQQRPQSEIKKMKEMKWHCRRHQMSLRRQSFGSATMRCCLCHISM